jgi:hypothetical protein
VYRKDFEAPPCQLELQHVIGRRAFDRRQNLLVDHTGRITYQAGSLQIFMSENEHFQKTQMGKKVPGHQ